MTSSYTIDLTKSGQDVPWGFRLQGGIEYGTALSIQRVFSGTPADGSLQRGDTVSKVNGNDVTNVTLIQAQELIKSAGNRLSLVIQRDSLPIQDLHISNQAPPFAYSDHHQTPGHNQPYRGQPPQHFQANSFPAQSSVTSHVPAGVSNVKFQPKPDHDFQQSQNFHHPPQVESRPAWQQPAPSQAPPQSSTLPHHQASSPTPPHQYQQHYEETHQQEPSGDVDDEHLRPVKEIKSMFSHGGSPRDGPNIVRTGHQVKIGQQKKPQGTTKYQPPSPANKPAATSHVQSAKYPAVYQQRSSYNPLDFQGVSPKSPIPPNRPPGLIQRGAVDLKPKGSSLDYQQPNSFKHDDHPNAAAQHHHQPHHQPSITPQGNLDPLTDFYLHGLNSKCEIPDFSKSTMAPYTGKILPQRSDVAIKTPTSAPKKKEFKADQSAVYRILQEEEQAAKQRPKGAPVETSSRAYQTPGSAGHSRLAELLEKDQAQLAPFQTEDQPDHHHYQHQQQQIHQQQHQNQQQQQQQHQHQHHQQYQQQPQHHQQYQHPQQQSTYAQPPQKHLMTSTAHFVPSPSREQVPRHIDYNDHHGAGTHGNYQNHHQQQQPQQHQQQHHYQNWNQSEFGRTNPSHSGLPETDF